MLGAIVPKGFLPSEDTSQLSGFDGDRAGNVLRVHGRAPEAAGSDRPGGLEHRGVHVLGGREWTQSDDESGAPVHAPEGSVRAFARCRRRRARAHAPSCRLFRGRASTSPIRHRSTSADARAGASISSRCRRPTSRRSITTPAIMEAEDARASRSHGRHQRSADQEPAGAGGHRSRSRVVARRHGQHDRECALQRLWLAPGLDDLHAEQPVLGGDGARAAVPEESRGAGTALRALGDRRSRSARIARAGDAEHRAGHRESLRPDALGDALVQPRSRAFRSARR